MRVKKTEIQRETIRKTNRFTRQSYRLFEKLLKIGLSVPRVPKGDRAKNPLA